MPKNTLPTLTLGALLMGVACGTASAMPVNAVPTPQADAARAIPAQYYDDDYYEYRRRPRITVYPQARTLHFDDYSNYPYARGFEDHNPVPRGNIRGCSVDLGYGRYESCDK